MHTGLVSSELFHSQGSYHSSNAECLMLIQICRKTTRQERGPISLHGKIHNHEFEMKCHNQQVQNYKCTSTCTKNYYQIDC